MDKNKTYILKNRSAGMVGYSIPEMQGLRREFMPGESKTVTFDELEKLSFQPGGRVLLEGFLQIIDEDVIESLNLETQDEYFMSEEQVAELIRTGSLDAFLDALDYAPTGVMDLIKQFAVAIPMTDTQKIKALRDKTGFDVESALRNVELEKEDDELFTPTTGSKAAAPANASAGRRTSNNYKATSESKYKIVTKTDDK